MNYQGYYSREQVIELVEREFPYINRPDDEHIFLYDKNDLMRKILSPRLEKFDGQQLTCEGVLSLYDEFSSITRYAVEWLFPSLLRFILRRQDTSDNLHWYLPTYFENMELDSELSAHNFNWLSETQIQCLLIVLEYVAEEYGESVATSQENLNQLSTKT
ncbi:hypothetical protein BCU64_014820 [Vibrio lentus]|nr:hypothetical protein [Vibrio lentus]PMH60815.1 hypothetical protein BCU64_17765 [Vibrio lentus]